MDYQNYTKTSKRLVLLTWFACFVSAILTYVGYRKLHPGEGVFTEYLLPALLAMLSGGGAFVTWHFIIDRYQRAPNSEKRQFLLKIGAGVIVFLLMTSTGFAAMGLAADRARIRAMKEIAAQAETLLAMLYRQRMQEAELVGPLEDMAGVHGSSEKREKSSGLVSKGRRGRGRVSDNVGGLREGFTEAANALKKQSKNAERLYAKGNGILGDIRAVVDNEEKGTEEKSRLIQKKLAYLNPIFIQLNNSSLPRVRSLIDGVDRLYMINDGSAKMERAMQSIAGSIGESKTIILDKLSELENTDEIFIKTYRVPDVFQAVADYWPYIAPAFFYALAADVLIPILAMLIVAYMAGEARDSQFYGSVKGPEQERHHEQIGAEYRDTSDPRVAARLRKLYRDSKERDSQSWRDYGDRGRPSSPN